MRFSPHSPRRQRKALYEAHTAERRRRMTVPLSRQLRTRFQTRAAPVRKGDTVRVNSGSFKGREERVARVNRRDYTVTLDNITLKTAGEKLKGLGLRPSHLVITRLNLADPWRRRALRVRDEDVTPEELGEAPETIEETPPAVAPPATGEAAPEAPAPDAETVTAEAKPAAKPRAHKAAPAEDDTA
ncbi:MAG: 50S ribosomal protein L24 [Thermoplasmata archaeon]